MGGLWPNGIALVAECWPGPKRPLVSGAMMAGLNAAILMLSKPARVWPVTPESWRWIFYLAGLPALLGVLAGFLFAPLDGDYSRAGALCAIVQALGPVVIWFAPNTSEGRHELGA
jgi:MFS family permease